MAERELLDCPAVTLLQIAVSPHNALRESIKT